MRGRTAASYGLVFAAALVAGEGCGRKATVTFTLEAPSDPNFSPLADARRDSVTLSDEIAPMQLGNGLRFTMAHDSQPLGDLPVGHYDLRLAIGGGGQVLGLARARGVDIVPGQDQAITLHVRKPIAYFGSSLQFTSSPGLPKPTPLMAVDTTLPAHPSLGLTIGNLTSNITASTTSNDGQFLVAAAGNTLYVIDTSQHVVMRSATLSPAVGNTPPNVGSIAFSTDDKMLVIASDQGLTLVSDFPALAAGNGDATFPTTKLVALQRAIFSPDGGTIKALVGPHWDVLDCTKPGSSAIYTIAVGNPIQLGAPAMSPQGYTDISYDGAGHLLIASPCSAQAILYEANSQPAMGLPGIYDVLATRDGKVIGVGSTVKSEPAAIDPQDPRIMNPTLPFVSLFISGTTPMQVEVPREFLDIVGADSYEVNLPPLAPNRLDAFDVALGPDGTHLVFAARLHYELPIGFHYYQVNNGTSPLYYCDIYFSEDVYRLFVVDLSSGVVSYQPITGINDSRCSTQCYNCAFGACNSVGRDRADCHVSEGYVPSGLSILMGTQ